MIRFRLSVLVFACLMVAVAVMANYQGRLDKVAFQRNLDDNSNRIGQNLAITIKGQNNSVIRMAERWRIANGMPENQWRADAQNYLSGLFGLTEIGAFDRNLKPYLAEPAAHPVLDASVMANAPVFATHTAGQLPNAALLKIAGTQNLLVSVPIGELGWLVGVFDSQKMIDGLTSLLAKKYYNVHFYDGAVPNEPYAIEPILIDGAKPFSIIITPTKTLYEARASKLPGLILIWGSVLAFLVAVIVQFVCSSISKTIALRRQSRAVLDSEAMLRLVMQNAPIGMALVSPGGKWLTVNPALCAILGYTEAELLQVDFQTITYEDDLSADLEHVQDLLAGQATSYTMPKRYYHKDGSLIWVLLSVALVWNIDGTPRSFISQIVDISQLKKADEEREQLIQKLVNTNAELERFAFVASHDLQEPLRMIFNFTNLLQQDYAPQLDSVARSYIEIATSSASRMRSLIEDLLNYARADYADAPAELFDSSQTMAYVKQNIAASLIASRADLIVGDLPQLRGNPMQFASLMQNLITNAIKYMPADRQPVVKVAVQREGNNWYFTVADNGIGMKADYCEQIFEPFKRLHNQQQYQGTGMGLAICRKIVSSFGGTIWAESRLGIGSTFCFTVPVIPD